jgi:hypothetical protein
VRGVVVLLLIVIALNGPARAVQPEVRHVTAAPPVSGWRDIEALQPRFVVFGELHGTVQSPSIVGDVAAYLTGDRHRILVALELGAMENPALQAAWAGPHDAFANYLRVADLAARDDGVRSAAMHGMLLRLHILKLAGAEISVVAFNSFRDEAQRARLETRGSNGGHEAAQAENIVAAANDASFDIVLVLVGRAHAQRNLLEFHGDRYLPMAAHLERHGRVVSLDMAYASGTYWGCALRRDIQLSPGQPVTSDMVECDAQSTQGISHVQIAPAIGLGRLPGMPDTGGFDGYYWVGPVTASPPAVP